MAKVLVVDDSSLSRRMLRRILELDGHQVIEADSGLAALEVYSLERPDLVMLDMTMEGLHGLDALSKLRELNPDVKVIVASADLQQSTRELAWARGAVDYVTKPFSVKEIHAAVTAALGTGEVDAP